MYFISADNLNVVKWQNVINAMNGSIRSVKAFQLQLKSNMVLRAVNAVYDDLNSFLALSYTMYYFHSSISNVFAHLIALMYIHILFLFNLHNVSEAISTINYRARNLSLGTFSPRQKCPTLGGTFY